MGIGVSQQKSPKMPGAHKIGAAISGPQNCRQKITDIRLFFSEKKVCVHFSVPTLRARILKKPVPLEIFNLAGKFQYRLRISILTFPDLLLLAIVLENGKENRQK